MLNCRTDQTKRAMINSGDLNERITVQIPAITRTANGEQVTTWAATKQYWANVRYVRGARAILSGDVMMTNAISIMMNWNDVVTERCRIVWDGKLYHIDSINRNKQHYEINITASRLDVGGTTEGSNG